VKIVFTIASLDPVHGGPSRSVPALADALVSLGLDVSLVCLRSPGESIPVAPNTFKLCSIQTNANRYVAFSASRRFRRAILCAARESIGRALLHDHGLWLPNNHASAQAAAHAGIRRVVSPRGMLSGWALKARAWKKCIAWALYQRHDLQSAALLHATSNDEAEEFRRVGLRNPIVIIPNGITAPRSAPNSELPAPSSPVAPTSDLCPLTSGSPVPRPVASAFNFQLSAFPKSPRSPLPAPRSLLFLSRIHPKKGLLDLIQAWAKLRSPSSSLPAPCSPWRVIIAGPDECGHQRELEAAATAAGVRDDFHFVGPVRDEDKWDLYRAADLFVLPSYSENFGIVVGEALAAGLPVITTRATPWAEIEHEQCGWWIEPGVESLAAALRQALSAPPTQLQEMGRRGRALIERRYSWSAAAQQMRAAYLWLLNQGPKPDCVHL
jgi:glycosyltransferase involved in cell wall biosynthesis